MNNQVFSINSYEKSTLLAGDNSFRFSSMNYDTVPDFEEGWNEMFTIGNPDRPGTAKLEIDYDKLRSIKKENSERQIHIASGRPGTGC